MLAFSGFESTFALLLDDRFGLHDGAIYLLFAVVGIALVFVQSRLVSTAHRRAGASSVVLRAAVALDAVGLALLAIDAGWWSLAPALALLVVGQGLLGPTLSSAVAGVVASRRRGEALGVQQSAGALGRVSGPLIAGALFQGIGPGAPYLVAAVLAAGCLPLVPDLTGGPRHRSSVRLTFAPASRQGGSIAMDDAFANRYGPYTLIAGASEGIGAAFARQIAERGVNLVLVARRAEPLDELAAEIRSSTGVDVRSATVDLTSTDVDERLARRC